MFRLSETAKAVLWLWYNDSDNWRAGSHAVVHQPTGVGVWTANECYGLHVNYNIPTRDRASCHPCNGRKLELKWRDRRTLYRAIVLGQSKAAHREIQRQISDWAADNIPNKIGATVSVIQ